MEELLLPLLVLLRDALVELAATFVAAADALDESAGTDGGLEGPLYFQHTPVLLEIDNGSRFLITFLLSLTKTEKVLLVHEQSALEFLPYLSMV